jgi:hypothetical protein
MTQLKLWITLATSGTAHPWIASSDTAAPTYRRHLSRHAPGGRQEARGAPIAFDHLSVASQPIVVWRHGSALRAMRKAALLGLSEKPARDARSTVVPSCGARPARCGGSLRRLGAKAISVRHDEASPSPLLGRLARVPPCSCGPSGAEPVTGMAPEHARRSALPTPTEREALAGLVERVTYHNPENGFCVLRVKIRGQRELVTS